jgi:hypothetical protein
MEYTDTYRFVRDKIKVEYDYEFQALKEVMRLPIHEIDVDEVDHRLIKLASIKMKLEILEAASVKVQADNKSLLLG